MSDAGIPIRLLNTRADPQCFGLQALLRVALFCLRAAPEGGGQRRGNIPKIRGLLMFCLPSEFGTAVAKGARDPTFPTYAPECEQSCARAPHLPTRLLSLCIYFPVFTHSNHTLPQIYACRYNVTFHA